MRRMGLSAEDCPLLARKDYDAMSLIEPANLLREARRQRDLPEVPVPAVGVLDPDRDIVRYLAATRRGRRHPGWACGAARRVGAKLVVSITLAGQVSPLERTPCFVLIDRALRDEGTSVHYVAPARWSRIDDKLLTRLNRGLGELPEPVLVRSSWTTDAQYQETRTAIAAAQREGIACVEMEAAALYAYATARGRAMACLAHVTNTMTTAGDDFEKGIDNGVHDALTVARPLPSRSCDRAASTHRCPDEALRSSGGPHAAEHTYGAERLDLGRTSLPITWRYGYK